MEKIIDQEQKRAIEASGGHFLVLAPPGCGKTEILSERIAYAHQNHGVAFEDMLCLTFTNRASRGMKERVSQRVGDDAQSIFVGNVHRFCSSFLFQNAIVSENCNIIDEEEVADILLALGDDYFRNSRGAFDIGKAVLIDKIDSYLQQRKCNHPRLALTVSADEFEHYYRVALEADFNPDKVSVANSEVRFALQFQQYKAEHGFISFSDLLIRAYDALRNDTHRAFKRYAWVQVDEVQDLNPLQIAIIDELTDKTGNFTAMYLGDEQQSIFSFLGAKLEQLRLLKNRCAGNILTLGANYRSPKYLLDIFNTYAEKELGVDPDLLPKAVNDVPKEQFDLVLTNKPTIAAEMNRVLAMIRYYLKFPDERLAVLVPTNAAADSLSNLLTNESVPHFKISGTDIFHTSSYRTIASLLCALCNEFNALAWARVLYGIGAIATKARAREFVIMLKNFIMTPVDLLREKTYLAHFIESYEQNEFVFFDTETTGLDVLEDDIVQIAAFKVRGGERVSGSDFNIFLETDKEIPEMLGDIPNPLVEAYARNPHCSREEGLARFIEYIGNAPILGHNVNYDYRILQSNVRKTLQKEVRYEVFDSLHLIKCVEPHLHRYKLAYLLEVLQLTGKNSHLADEDIAATKALVDYCFAKAKPQLAAQNAFLAKTHTQSVRNKMQVILPLIEELQEWMYQPISVSGHNLADALRKTSDFLIRECRVEELDAKFDVFLRFVENEWIDKEKDTTLFDQICAHLNDMTSSINEGDLVNSENLIAERVFIMTVYKGKGLEFDNVVILNAMDGKYPFFMTSKILTNSRHYPPEIVVQAQLDYKEDARKFYVALSRAKKRLCVSYALQNEYGYSAYITPFMRSIVQFFTKI